MAASPVRIGPYELVSRLGVGGMADTFVAVRHGPGGFQQRVCLKRVRRDLERDPEFVRQFLAEAAIAARLRHAAIAQVLDFGCEHDDYYMALELIEGLDLRALLEEVGGGLPPEIVLHIATELTTALDFAHRAGGDDSQAPVVHRDVSASNALISVEGEVKLADFGIARSLGGPAHTQTGVVKGKVPYLAPEYARSGRFDVRCDLFSLGVLLYEIACGERPHDGATDLETLENATRATRRPLLDRAPALPLGLTEIVEQLLEPDPELRFQSAGALLEALLGLPASGRARRELGALVTSIKRAQLARPGAAVEQELPRTLAMATNPGAAAHASTPVATSTGDASLVARFSPRRGPRLALAVAVVFASTVLGLWAVRTFTAQPAARAPAVVAPAAATVALTAPSATPANTAAAADPEPPPDIVQRPSATSSAPASPVEAPADARATRKLAGARTQRAQLEVIVLPYGEVFVDGKRIGETQVKVGLSPGEHEVVGKHRSGSIRRRVVLTAGERRQLVLR